MSAPNQLSFLPDDYLERKARRRTNIVCAFLFVVVMGVIAATFAITERSLKDIEQQHAAVEAQYAEAAKRIEQVKEMQEKQRRMAQQAELTASLLEKVPRSFLLAELTNSRPAGVSLLDLALDSRLRAAPAPPPAQTAYEQKKQEAEAKQKAPVAQPKLYDVAVKLTGLAQTDVQVAQYISRLSRSPLLKDVNLVIVDEHDLDGEKVRKFQLDMMLSPTADVQGLADKLHDKTAAVELEQ